MAASLKLYNTLTRDKVDFEPIDPNNVRMYVCGPTVYDFAHIGNARPVIVFDVLYRLLRHVYGESHVTYVRNITDVDDKINARALRDFGAQITNGSMTLNDAIRAVTGKTESQFHADVAALGCLKPTVEPRATDNIPQMIAIIQQLLDQGHAYVASGSGGREVLFSTASMADYGQLSKRRLEDQQAGARIAVEAHKMNPADFVLWKQSADTEPGWTAEYRFEGETVSIHGRPGWHIECSAMSDRYLWEEIKDRLSPKAKARPHQFDIHGGGLDLIFPHHENEIAQSCCAYDTDIMANVWMHNGFVQVEGRKMSKSEGNFVTINELLETEKFGGRKWPGEVLRLAMLMTHYREPIDFSVKRLEEAERLLAKWPLADAGDATPDASILNALADDLNTVAAVQALHTLAQAANSDPSKACVFAASAALLGIEPKKTALSDDLSSAVQALVDMRLEMLKAKNFAEADKIRDDLLTKGIQLKDGKDKETGERVTTWEVKR
ncbi:MULTISPECIES: cysteine--tRNA ligase [Alphaproteobacteria]|uniref:Cysteine--tRNA ligase n=2 Tax=Alphaproteobacteria TaxID=28211 RepID=A0A512HGD9_9HYPH|nr:MULTISPECIES: cysteine--tRNA ligase [Alphaproteobacteria]GEO84518.1 cysteine--tRNA ligase [Ciceribacter naphthalenivorans]GLR22481.1 cysteine--tRNA ligase [Ciceribacter naphthalenivorans]GLT05337.1 cysteine--tRNA ligase [Sphingomonas psychrolutea]